MTRFPGYMALLTLTFLIAAFTGHGQYYFRHYQAENGLAHNAVSAIIQDRNGLMWIGTRGGLNSFDGYTFKSYENKNQPVNNIGNNIITVLLEDANRTLWVATGKGLFKYDPYKEVSTKIEAVPATYISHLELDDRNNLIILTNSQLYRYNDSGHTIENLQVRGSCMTADGHKGLWIGRSDGTIGKYDYEKKTVENSTIIDQNVPSNQRSISRIYPINDNELLIGCFTQGLKIYNHKTKACRSLPLENNKQASIYVRDIIKGEAQEYWIATESGVYIYSLADNSVLHLTKQAGDPYSISDNAVYTFFKDRQGSMWVGTYFGGLNYYSKENAKFKKYYPVPGIPSISGNAVRTIVPDTKNNLWVGTEDAGINKLDLKTAQFTNYTKPGKKESISYYNVHGLLAVGNQLYIGMFYNGLDIMDTRSGKITDRFKLIKNGSKEPSDFVTCIYLTKDSTVLIGTAYHGPSLYEYDPRQKTFKNVPQIPHNVYTFDITEDSQGNIWTGSVSRGAFYYNPRTGAQGNLRFGDTLNHKIVNEFAVYNVFEDSNHFLWFSTTGGGLIKLSPDRKTMKRYTTKNGLPTNVLYAILEDSSKHLWISSLKGIIRLHIETEDIKVYTQANGLLTDQFNYNAAYKHSDGTMYFGSIKGLIAFNPSSFDETEQSPPTFITGFRINNKEVTPDSLNSPFSRSILYTDTVVLQYNQNNFSIEFAALNFSAPEVTRYKYRMKGLDLAWTYLSTNRHAYFTDLAPGKYEFIVQAESNTESWAGKERRLIIRILPPFWKSNTAYVLYAMLLAAGLYFVVRFYHRYTERKNLRKLQLFELQKEKEIYQAKIEFFTNITHEIQTPLTLIAGPVGWLKKKFSTEPEITRSLTIAEKNIQRLVELASQLLDFRKTEANQFSLNFVKTDIIAVVADLVTAFKQQTTSHHVDLNLVVPESPLMAFVDREAFIKICSNLVSNAVKYAAKRATVTINESDNHFTIQFKNDGKGIPEEYRQQIFEPFFRLKGNTKPGTGIGLSIAKALTELHNGSLQLVSGKPDQVIFELKLPVHQKFEFQLSSWKKIG